MKKAKKLLALVLVTVMSVCALTACGSSKEEPATWEDQLGNKGTIRVGISPNYPPYDFYDEAGNIVGYDADFAAYLEEYLEYANALIASEDEDILTKYSDDGDFMYFRESTGEFLVLADDGYIRTYFIPDDGIEYWNRQ